MANAETRRMYGTALICCVIMGLILLVLLPFSIQSAKTEQQCRIRLRLLGRAVNHWVLDHQRQKFPHIANPAPLEPWVPLRDGSASEVLRDYLAGDIPRKQREGESEAAWLERRRSQEVTVDPATGFEFWYNTTDLATTDPKDIATCKVPERWYFRAQRLSDGSWPYEYEGRQGTWTAFGHGIQRQISEAEVRDQRATLNDIEVANAGKPMEEWTHDLIHLRREVSKLEMAIENNSEVGPDGRRYIVRVALEERIDFADGF